MSRKQISFLGDDCCDFPPPEAGSLSALPDVRCPQGFLMLPPVGMAVESVAGTVGMCRVDMLGTTCNIPCGTPQCCHVCCSWDLMGDTQQGHAQAAFLGQCVTADSCQPVWDTAVTVVCTTPRVSSHPGPHGATAWGGELSDEEVTSCHCVSKGK